MPDPAAEPPALLVEPEPPTGTVTLSTSLFGDLQVPGYPDQAATLQALAAPTDCSNWLRFPRNQNSV